MNKSTYAYLKDNLETRICGLFDEAVKEIDTEDIINDEELKDKIKDAVVENMSETISDWAEEIILDLL